MLTISQTQQSSSSTGDESESSDEFDSSGFYECEGWRQIYVTDMGEDPGLRSAIGLLSDTEDSSDEEEHGSDEEEHVPSARQGELEDSAIAQNEYIRFACTNHCTTSYANMTWQSRTGQARLSCGGAIEHTSFHDPLPGETPEKCTGGRLR